MAKINRIIYWIATAWLSLGMLSTGLVQLLQVKKETAFILDMGYPSYFLVILGAWKILGVIVILLPGLPLLKEWTYAGFFFAMSGAVFSHLALGHGIGDIFPAMLLLVLTMISWYFRPPARRVILATFKTKA
jgi:hypothetical protein